jgi:hypothetical protein
MEYGLGVYEEDTLIKFMNVIHTKALTNYCQTVHTT